jgi:adenylate cyclase
VENIRAAFNLLERALERDPHFARASALQGGCLLHLFFAGLVDLDEAAPRALRLAEAALTSGADDWEALSLAALVTAWMGGNIQTALSASQRALTLNPNAIPAFKDNGFVQCAAGNPSAAIDSFTRALRLSPRDPYRGYCEVGLALAHRDLGRPEEALVWGRRAILSLPLYPGGYRATVGALADLGRIEEAKDLVAQLLKVNPQSRIRPEYIRRINHDQDRAESYIAALRLADLPE